MHYLKQVSDILRQYEASGSMVLPTGTRLIGRAPHVGSNAWVHIIFAPITDEDIVQLEKEIGYEFPTTFSDFLTMMNGVSLFSNTISIYGLRSNYKRHGDDVWQPFDIITPNVYERPPDTDPSILVIGGYPSGTGYYLFMDTRDQSVGICTRKSSVPLHKWVNFENMMVSEVNRISKFFDKLGRPNYVHGQDFIGHWLGRAK